MKKRNIFSIAAAALLSVAGITAAYAREVYKVSEKPVTLSALRSTARHNEGFKPPIPPSMVSPAQFARERSSKERQKAFAAQNVSIPEMVGLVDYMEGYSDDKYMGFYYLPTTAEGSMTPVITGGVSHCYNAVQKDGVYYMHWGLSIFGNIWYYVNGYDFDTKRCVWQTPLRCADEVIGADITLDPTSGVIYGLMNNGTGYMLATVDYLGEGSDGEVKVNKIAEMPEGMNWEALASDADGQLYAISSETDAALYKIDKTNGALNKIGNTGVSPYFSGSATIDSKTGRCFWSVSPEDHKGALYEVDLNTGNATLIYNFPANAGVVGLVVPAPLAEAEAPAAPVDLSLDFPEGSLTGKVNFSIPSVTFGGTAATGQVSYTVSVDNTLAVTGTSSFGASESVDVTIRDAGTHTVDVVLSNEHGNSPKSVIKQFFGKDVPMAPTNVKASFEGNKVTVTWNPVTESVNGGYVDPAEITYTVRKGTADIAEGIKGCSYSETFDVPDGLTVLKFSVQANYAGKNSAYTSARDLVFGNIIPPYKQTFDSPSSLYEFVNVSPSKGNIWEFKQNNFYKQDMPSVKYSFTKDKDAWLITAPLKLEGGKAYKVDLDMFGTDTELTERIEIKAGRDATPDAMLQTVVEPTESSVPEAKHLSGFITTDDAGLYYLGIHAISDKDRWYVYIDNLEISGGLSSSSPAGITNLKLAPGLNGAKTVDIEFNAPDKDFTGNALTSLGKVEVYNGIKLINTFQNPAPGELLKYQDAPAAAGDYEYTVVGYNEHGEGQRISGSVYVGLPYPSAVEEATMIETSNPGEVTVTWSPVSTDENGQPLAVEYITYSICPVDENGVGEPVGSGLKGTTHTFRAVENGSQEFVQYAVFAETERGRGKGADTNMLPVGTPQSSFGESFANGGISSLLGVGYETQGEWGVYKDMSDIQSSDADNGFACMYSGYGGDAGLFTGKISLANIANPAFSFAMFNWTDANTKDENEVQLDVREVGKTAWNTIAAYKAYNLGGEVAGWYPVVASLAEYAGKTIQVKVQAYSRTFSYVPVDALKIISLVNHDLSIRSINSQKNVKTGSNFNLQVEVANEGGKNASEYKVSVYADNKLVETKVYEGLASGGKNIASFNLVMHPLATQTVKYHAIVEYDVDENMANNESSVLEIEPILSTLPCVTDLLGEKTAQGVSLSWGEPYLGGANSVVENFDKYTGTQFSIEGWTFVDKDNEPLSGLSDGQKTINIDGITPGSTKASFFTFDTNTVTYIDASLKALSGDMVLATLAPQKGANNDWAISPELSGKSQTIRFSALSFVDTYPEKIRVLYSTGSVDPADFVEVKTIRSIPENWTPYEVQLPEGAKRFAINSCATNGSLLLIDNITYSTRFEAMELTLAGFNIYRNGEKMNSELVEDFEYVDDTKLPDIGARYAVTAVYEGEGESGASNIVDFDYTSVDELLTSGISVSTGNGFILVKGLDGEEVSVYDVQGRMVSSGQVFGEMRISAVAGIYLVRIGSNAVKVVVR